MLVPDAVRDRHSAHRADYAVEPHTRSMGADLELYARRKDGSEFPVEISLSPLVTVDGLVVFSAIRDITVRKRDERDASHFRSVVESSHDAIISKTLDGIIMSWNTGAEQLYGYTAAEAEGMSMSVLVPRRHDDDLPDILRRVSLGERVDRYETVRMKKDGGLVDVSLTVSPIHDRNGNVVAASTIARDISERRRYQKQLEFLAEHDPLTEVFNRRRFEHDLNRQVGRAHRYHERAVLLMIDLNGFKQINDIFGHEAGDRVLKTTAEVLKHTLRETDVVARIGGDEFAILMPYASPEDGAVVASFLREAIRECRIDGAEHKEIRLSASIGLARIEDETPNGESVLAEADRMMYEDKRRPISQR